MSTATAPRRTPRLRVIEPVRTRSTRALRDVWEHRDLLFLLARRDVAVRYTQALFGFGWAILQPVALAVVFSLVVRRAVDISVDAPYPLFTLAGLSLWIYFLNSVTSASESLVRNANLVSKVYFPRMIIPLAACAAWLVDLVAAFGVLGILMAIYGAAPGPQALLAPLFVAFALLASVSVVLWLSALNVAYRDLRYAVPFMLQIWFFVTPVMYPASAIPSRFAALYGLNPMAGAIEGLRWSLLGTPAPEPALLAASIGVVCALLVSGLAYFRRVEIHFADVI